MSDLPRLSRPVRRRNIPITTVIERLESRDVPSSPAANSPVGFSQRYFDFGPDGSPLAFRFTPVSDLTTYSAGQGYGWLLGAPLQAIDRGVGNALTRDFVQGTDANFAVDVPAGNYAVTVVMGDSVRAITNVKITLEGALVDTVNATAGQVKVLSYTTQVSDGQLNISLAGAVGSQGSSQFPLNAVILRQAIQATLTYSGPATEGSTGSQVTFSGAGGGVGNFTYSFDFGGDGTFEVVNTAATMASVPASYLADGPANLRVVGRVRDAAGSFTDYTVVIPVTNVPPTPVATVPGTGTSGSPVQFLASATDPSPTDTSAGFTYTWTFGDGASASGASANHTYAAAGTYSVTLRATDKDGGFNTTTRQIVVSQGTPQPIGSYILTANDRIPNFGANPTVTAAASGNWSNPAIWSTGQVPIAGDVVSIGTGKTVSYDLVSDVQIKTVAIQSGGSLRFRTDINTRLMVINLLVLEGGELQIGTAANPVQPAVKAEVIFPNVAIDTATDPEQWGHGLIALGRVTTHGAVKDDTYLRLASEPMAGSTTLALAFQATGWRAGDRVVLPDSRQLFSGNAFDNPEADLYYKSQREMLTIASVAPDGMTITLNQPLQFDHRGARDGNGVLNFLPHVANLTRNIVMKSQSAIGVRGHTLFTARADVDIRFSQFSGLGRTTVDPLNNTTYDALGNPSQIGTNQTSRYPVNFHHLVGPAVPQPGGYQFTFQGNSVFCPIDPMNFRWGIALHDSSYGLIQDNVLYNWAGAGIVADTGSETGNVIANNYITRISQWGRFQQRPDARGNGPDFAFEGSGLWFRGYANFVRDNVVSESRTGYTYFSYNSFEARAPIAQGADPSQPGQYRTVRIMYEPIAQFERNEIYGGWTTQGMVIWALGVQGGTINNPTQAESVVKDFRVWHVFGKAYFNYETKHLTFDGAVIRGDWAQFAYGLGFNTSGFYAGDYLVRQFKITNSDIQGVGVGFDAGNTGGETQVIENTYFRSYCGITILPQYHNMGGANCMNRTLILRNNTFELLNVPDMYNWVFPRTFIAMAGLPQSEGTNYIVQDDVFVYGYNGNANDNFRLYYSEQAANAIVPQTTYYPDGRPMVVGAPVAGLTNAQAQQQYGVAYGGSIAPATAVGRNRIVGLAQPIGGN